MYKLTIEVLKAKVRDIDHDLIYICLNGGNAYRLINTKYDILRAIKVLEASK